MTCCSRQREKTTGKKSSRKLTKGPVFHTVEADTVSANSAAVRRICRLITCIAAQLCVGVAPIGSVHHGIDPELSLTGPVYSIGNSIIQQQTCNLQNTPGSFVKAAA